MYLTWIQRTEYGHGEVDEQQRQKLGFVAKYAEITVYLILKYNARSWWKVVKVTFIKNHIQKILIKEKPINQDKRTTDGEYNDYVTFDCNREETEIKSVK